LLTFPSLPLSSRYASPLNAQHRPIASWRNLLLWQYLTSQGISTAISKMSDAEKQAQIKKVSIERRPAAGKKHS
jgi:hypothetical protein